MIEAPGAGRAADLCALCGRPLGRLREDHHLVPRSLGGRETVSVHPICHRKIHALLSEKEIRVSYDTMEKLRAHPEIANFIRWVRRRPPDFHRRTKTARPTRR